MSNIIKIDPKFINKSEIARRIGVTPQYIQMILTGKRKANHIREKINSIIKKELRAA